VNALELVRRSRELAVEAAASVPLPARGATSARWRTMWVLGREDLSVARLVEPHLDAVAILAEAGRRARPDCWYAVWASAPRARLAPRSDGSWDLTGTQAFCSGAPRCDAALVTAQLDDDVVLVDVDLRAGRTCGSITVDESTWRAPAFAATGTATVTYDGHRLPAADVVGAPGFYLDRPGFWHGAIGPAAVWAGGAAALTELAEHRQLRTQGERMLRGELRSLTWSMSAQLERGGVEADELPDDVEAARRRALVVRSLVERQCSRVIDLFGQLAGPRALALDDDVVRRVEELSLYIRQVNRAADLDQLGGEW
jgi:alkylation response protein AidB-like acyl-CoA dehydrogenase